MSQKFQRDTENYRYLHISEICWETWSENVKKKKIRARLKDFSDTLAPMCQQCLRELLTYYCNWKAPWIPRLSTDIVCGSLALIITWVWREWRKDSHLLDSLPRGTVKWKMLKFVLCLPPVAIHCTAHSEKYGLSGPESQTRQGPNDLLYKSRP